MKKEWIFIAIFLIVIIVVANYIGKNMNKSNSSNESKNIESENNVSAVEFLEYESILDGKAVSIYGDSLFTGYGTEKGGIENYLLDEISNVTFTNSSVAGSTLTTNTGEDNIVILNQIQTSDIEYADIIMFNGGINDIIGYDLGFLNTDLEKEIGTAENLDNTVMGDVKDTIQVLKEKYPDAKLCYIQMCLLDDETIDNLIEMYGIEDDRKEEVKTNILNRKNEFFEQLQLICNDMDVDYLDVSYLLEGTSTEYRNEDLLHFNENGYELLTPYILNYLAKQVVDE